MEFAIEHPKTTFVFLDLEETCIDEWNSNNLLIENLKKIDLFLNGKEVVIPHKNGPPTINPPAPIVNLKLGLMSWAVWGDVDKERFVAQMQEPIEHAINRKFDEEFILSMRDFAHLLRISTGKCLSPDDMFDLFGKPEVLFALVRKHEAFRDSFVFLIDDAYEHNLEFKSPMNACYGSILNINKM